MSRRTWFVAALAVVALVGLSPIAVVGSAFVGNPPIPDGQVLPGGAIVVATGYVSAFVQPLPDGKYLLVDSGGDPEGVAIDAALAARGASAADVVTILLTHGHTDHVAACDRFPNAQVWAGEPELPLIRGAVAAKGPIPRWLGKAAAPCAARVQTVADGAVLALAEGLQARAFPLPGHTAGSTAWLVGGVLYFGDAADGTTEGELVGPKWVFSDDVALAERSLVALAARVAGQRVDALAFAHTGTLTGQEALQRFASAHR